jgi:integrase
MKQKLTKSFVAKILAAPPPDETVYTDSEIPGFILRCRPGPQAAYFYRWKAGGRSRKKHLGSATILPADEARTLALKHRYDAKIGEGIQRQKKVYLEELRDRHLAEHCRPNLRPASVVDAELIWNTRILPVWGGRLVTSITRGDALKLKATIALESKSRCNHTVALLSKAFNLAEDWGMRPLNSNPFRRIGKYEIAGREKILTTAELVRFHAALDRLDLVAPVHAALFRLLLLTGARLREIMNAKLAWVDFDRRLLLLPDSKTGAGVVELPPQAIAIIRAVKRPEGSEWLLPKEDGQPIVYPYRRWKQVLEWARIEDFRIHDERHCFGSYSHRSGASQKTVAKLLRHKVMSTTERYLQGFDRDRQEAADKTANVLLGES